MRGRAGFTLVEALVALAVTGILMLLVSTTFLAQNDFYANILQRARVHDNARTVAEIVGTDLRAVMPGGIVVADSARLVVRVPMALGTVCGVSGSSVSAHVAGGEAALDQSITPRMAIRNGPGSWTYYTETWASVKSVSGDPAGDCAGAPAFADTAGAADEFYRLNTGGVGGYGDVFMVYRETEYRIQPSALYPNATALYRGPSGGTLVELASYVADDAQFAYRKGGGAWANRFTSGLGSIDRVRVYARARGPAETAAQADVTFDLVVDVPLRNIL